MDETNSNHTGSGAATATAHSNDNNKTKESKNSSSSSKKNRPSSNNNNRDESSQSNRKSRSRRGGGGGRGRGGGRGKSSEGGRGGGRGGRSGGRGSRRGGRGRGQKNNESLRPTDGVEEIHEQQQQRRDNNDDGSRRQRPEKDNNSKNPPPPTSNSVGNDVIPQSIDVKNGDETTTTSTNSRRKNNRGNDANPSQKSNSNSKKREKKNDTPHDQQQQTNDKKSNQKNKPRDSKRSDRRWKNNSNNNNSRRPQRGSRGGRGYDRSGRGRGIEEDVDTGQEPIGGGHDPPIPPEAEMVEEEVVMLVDGGDNEDDNVVDGDMKGEETEMTTDENPNTTNSIAASTSKKQSKKNSNIPTVDVMMNDPSSSINDEKKSMETPPINTSSPSILNIHPSLIHPPSPPPSPPPPSTTQILSSLPPTTVSITSSSTITLLKKPSSQTSLASLPTKKKKKSSSTPHLHAARAFNRAVRSCVDRSSPSTLRTLLHNPTHHHYALDRHVLETVMKAYVMAAMFDDALYCLRNVALPNTLRPSQTEKILSCLPQNLRNSSAYTAADMINALGIATHFASPAARTYFLRIARGIALEFLEEATAARDRICSVPCERLVRSAQCVVDATLRRGKKKASDLIVIPGNQLGVFVVDGDQQRGIQAGDAVSVLPYAGPYPMSAESLDRNMIEATVTNANPLTLRLQDRSNASLYVLLTDPSEGNVYRIDKLANRMGFNRQLAAVVGMASEEEGGRRPSQELIMAISAMNDEVEWEEEEEITEIVDGQTKVKTKMHKKKRRVAELCQEAVRVASVRGMTNDEDMTEEEIRMESHLSLEKFGALEGLNESQKLAVEGAVTNRLTLVQGPPGTGKTAVAIRILQHWARLSSAAAALTSSQPHPILATSDSNIAVDNLVEGCAAIGLRVVRLGRPEAIRPELLPYCIDRPQSTSYNGVPYAHAPQIPYKEKMKILKKAQVICCTCIGSGGDILENMTFEKVLVDEATQATEPAVLVPLSRGCKQLVLVGDHCQLPPTVLSTRADEEGLSIPLFSRMVACNVPPFMLDTQYRMHPAIATFPSDLFYGGKLRNGVSPPERRPLAGFPWPREEFPVAFVPVTHGVEMDDGVSKLNEAEAAAACDAVAALLSGGQCTVQDIAVVTPYAAQVRLVRRLTRKLVQRPPYVEVSSTDGFQGREKEAVVFTAVRSNSYGAVGFVSDWRRVNVSFTRARRALIVIGNDATLRRGDPETWMPWLAWADANGINMDKPGVPRGRYDAEQLRRVRGGISAGEMLREVLERQKAQLKVAERQLETAERNAVGCIRGDGDSGGDGERGGEEEAKDGIGGGTGDDGRGGNAKVDLSTMFGNEDGCWDDDDEDDDEIVTKSGGPGLTKKDVLLPGDEKDEVDDEEEEEEVLDAWDL